MPDVFKVLKDLELKSVGLDEQTQKMQEGYFVSFRSVGLPIHKEDFVRPWSPLGGNLEATLNKDIPKTEPSDPANAPKTGSTQMDEDKIAIARIGQSMQSYLNAFLLTDDQLRMSNQYAVMPHASKVSDAWWAIITGANGIPTESVLNPAMQKAYDDARAKVMDKDGNPTPHYQAYLQFEDEYKSKIKAWQRAYAAAYSNPIKFELWPIEGASYHDDANEAWDRWMGFGFKGEIDTALATLAAQGTDPAIALIARAKKRFVNSLNQFQNIGMIPYTIMLPRSWYDSDNNDGWTQYTSTDFHTESHYQASSTSYGGGGGFLLGFWGAGSFNHSEEQKSLDIRTDDLEVTFNYCVVDIKRPWLDTSLLNLKNWFLMGDYKKGCISDGTMGQELGENAPTFLPSIVTGLILVKDLSIKWSNWKSDWDSLTKTTSASASLGWGPFAVHGHYSHHSAQRDFTADSEGESLVVPGIQLIGYVSMINPLSPGVDSSQFLTKPPTP